jgi:AGZA family xanthine/uracil permease-like MFS transporter
MLSVTGIPFEDALFATAIAAFVGCMAMAFWANEKGDEMKNGTIR